MAYVIEISRRDVDYYNADGEHMEGDRRELRNLGTTAAEYDEWDAEDYGSPVAWAIAHIRKTDACEPSVYPVPDVLGESAWLSGSYNHPYTSAVQETTAYVKGDFTDAERAEVFRGVAAR